MWALTLLLFVLTCIYTKLQFKKVQKYYDDLHYDIVELQLKNLDKGNDDSNE